MNNFTKEELLKLYDYVWAYDRPSQEKDKLLLNKIQSMIDNYCDHNYENTYRMQEYFICTKCGDDKL